MQTMFGKEWLDALNAGIKKWDRHANTKVIPAFSEISSDTCELCKLSTNEEGKTSCRKCPVDYVTKMESCLGIGWHSASSHLTSNRLEEFRKASITVRDGLIKVRNKLFPDN